MGFPLSINPRAPRDHRRLVLDLIHESRDGTTRAEIARSLDLSRSAVSGQVDDLLHTGLVRELDKRQTRAGRKPIGLEINASPGQIVGVDVGATHIRAILADIAGRPLAELSTSFDVKVGPEKTLAGVPRLGERVKFKKAIKVSFGYSKTLFASGQTDNDVNMHYYDESFLRWQKLSRVKVDSAQSLVESESDHFTDIINSTLVVPEHPQALSFNPNSIKDIKAADPSANINLIEPPQGTNMGTANLSYPIEIPKCRGAHTPDLKVTYSSSNTNGWMGLGWDIPVSRIQVDTRWGVPPYDYGALVSGSPKETESHLLDGATLASYAPRPFATETLEDRSTGDKVFRKRVERDFQLFGEPGVEQCFLLHGENRLNGCAGDPFPDKGDRDPTVCGKTVYRRHT